MPALDTGRAPAAPEHPVHLGGVGDDSSRPGRRPPAAGPFRRRAPSAGIAIATTVAVLLGATAIGAGAGVALPHVGTGHGLVALTGAVAAGIGLVAVVVGAMLLTRPLRARWRVLLGAVVLLVVATVAYVVAIPVVVTTSPGPDAGSETPGDVGLPYESVTVPTTDGARLAGWYVPTDNGAAVLLLHGSGSTRSTVLEHAAVLAGHGYGVLLLEARGHGASTGRAMLWGWYGEDDVPRAAAYLADRPDVDDGRVAVVGLSMGGEEALGAAAGAPTIRAVVAEGVTGRSGHDLGWLADAYGWRGTLTQTVHHAQAGIAGVLADAHRPPPLTSAVAQLPPASVLLVAAGRSSDEQHAAAALEAAAPDVVEVWVADDADHTGALRADRTGWETRVIELLDRTLAPG